MCERPRLNFSREAQGGLRSSIRQSRSGSFGPSPRITAAELQRAQGSDESLMAQYERTFDYLAEIVTAAVGDGGLRYDWDGDTQSRIKIVEMCWRRPLPIASESRRTPPPPRTQRFGFGFQ